MHMCIVVYVCTYTYGYTFVHHIYIATYVCACVPHIGKVWRIPTLRILTAKCSRDAYIRNVFCIHCNGLNSLIEALILITSILNCFSLTIWARFVKFVKVSHYTVSWPLDIFSTCKSYMQVASCICYQWCTCTIIKLVHIRFLKYL